MNHSEAVQQLASERYLLDELSPDARDAFEEHMFSCPQCALDVRAGTLFVDEAKAQLPEFTTAAAADRHSSKTAKNWWSLWWRPAFAVPVFAALLVVVGYQNLVTIPALQTLEQPRILPNAPLYGATRGSSHVAVTADRGHGIALPVDIPIEPGIGIFASYGFELYGPRGKLAWSGTVAAPAQEPGGDLQLSLVIPGRMLQTGSYTLSVVGIGAKGERSEILRQVFDVTLTR